MRGRGLVLTRAKFFAAPNPRFTLSPSFMDPPLLQGHTEALKGSYVAQNENGPLTGFAIVVYRIFSCFVRTFECPGCGYACGGQISINRPIPLAITRINLPAAD